MTILKNTQQTEPPVIIDVAHYERLSTMADLFSENSPNASERLLDEISRADVKQYDEIPANVVNLESQVTYRDNKTGQIQTVYLVWPSEANIEKRKVSVLTPVGAALIGLSEGASIDWETNSGEIRKLTILQVKN